MKGKLLGLLAIVLLTAHSCLVVDAADTSWSITIPKHLEIDGSTGECTYEVSCSGEIEPTKIVEVKPDSSFYLRDADSNKIQANVTQNVTQFINSQRKPKKNQAKSGTSVSGSIAVDELDSGEWFGSFAFHISSAADTSITYEDKVLRESDLAAAGIEASGDIVIPSTYFDNGIFYRVVGLGTYVFAHNAKIISVVMPNTVKTIDICAFWDCANLESVTFSENLTKINASAFAVCKSLKSVYFKSTFSLVFKILSTILLSKFCFNFNLY